MPLPEFFKLHVLNDTGAEIQCSTDHANNVIEVFCLFWKRDSDGAVEYDTSETTLLDCSSNLANQGIFEGTEFDNSAAADLWEGGHCRVNFTTDASVDGDLLFYIEHSTGSAAAGTYPSDSADFDKDTIEQDLKLVGVLSADTADDDRGTNFNI